MRLGLRNGKQPIFQRPHGRWIFIELRQSVCNPGGEGCRGVRVLQQMGAELYYSPFTIPALKQPRACFQVGRSCFIFGRHHSFRSPPAGHANFYAMVAERISSRTVGLMWADLLFYHTEPSVNQNHQPQDSVSPLMVIGRGPRRHSSSTPCPHAANYSCSFCTPSICGDLPNAFLSFLDSAARLKGF